MKIYHVVLPEIWEVCREKESYAAESLGTEGFIHCSYAEQLDGVLERYYQGRARVLILEIETAKLSSRLVAEPSTGGEVFPHIYGEINREAIVGVESRRLTLPPAGTQAAGSMPVKEKMHKNFAEILKPDSADARLLERIDPARLPAHVAIIMDGNGRWARKRGKPRIYGHQEGAESVRAILDTCARLEIEALTLYAFSTENWKRPKPEVSGLMEMLKFYIRKEIDEVHENKIRFQAIGRIEGLAADVRAEIRQAEQKTAGNTGTKLNVALNYGGRAEIVEACRKAFEKLSRNGRSIGDLSEEDIEQHLYTHGLPEVDLLIRTSGEMRISNFLLWQIAYSEIYVTDTLFPDFRRREFLRAILEFQNRDRRFGGIK